MRYHIEDIEDQILETLADEASLHDVSRETHAGQIDQQMFVDPAYVEGLITRLPFVYVQYMGKFTASTDSDSLYSGPVHTLRFRFYVGSQSLRSRKESQRSAYALLRSVYDAIHGKVPNPSPQVSGITQLSGTASTTTGFSPQGVFEPAGGMDEQMIMLQTNICVYQTDYTIRMLA